MIHVYLEAKICPSFFSFKPKVFSATKVVNYRNANLSLKYCKGTRIFYFKCYFSLQYRRKAMKVLPFTFISSNSIILSRHTVIKFCF